MHKASSKVVRPVIAIVLVVGAFLTAGCTSSSEPGKDSSSPAAVEVPMRSMAFAPTEKTVPAGATVRWTNEDDMPHDVTGAGGTWQSSGGPGGLTKGEAFDKRFDEPGVYEYYCTLHSSGPGNGMAGKIVVP